MVVEIANQGIPIPTETAPKVFEKFYRGTDTKTGAGLGLAICRGIAEAHGGRIWLEPGTDYAVQFRIEIPLPSERPEIPMED